MHITLVSVVAALYRTMSTTNKIDPNNELPVPVPYNNQYAPSFPFGIVANSCISSTNAFQPLPSNTVIMSPMYAVFARLICGDQNVLIIGHRVVVGRARRNNAVDFQVARDTLISRKHFFSTLLQWRIRGGGAEQEWKTLVRGSTNGSSLRRFLKIPSYIPL